MATNSSYTIMIEMAADVARLKKDMDEAKKHLNVVSTSVGSLKNLLGTLGVGLSIGAITGYFKGIVTGALEAADNTDELAQKLGVSAQFLEENALAAKVSGASMETLANGLKFLNRNTVEAIQGSKQQVEAFRALGIEYQDSTGHARNAEAVFRDLADVMSSSAESPERVALALQLMGRSGNELLPTLSLGGEGLEKFTAISKSLGLVLDGETREAAARVNDAMTITGQLSQGLGNTIMKALLPTLEGLTAETLDAATNFGLFESVADIVSAAFKLIVSAAGVVIGVFNTLGKVIGVGASAIVSLLKGDFMGAWQTVKEGTLDVGASIADTATKIAGVWTGNMKTVDDYTVKVSRTLNTDLKVGNENAAKAMKKGADEAAKLADKFSQMTAVTRATEAQQRKLTAAETEWVKVLDDVSRGTIKLTPEELKRVAIAADAAMKAEKLAEEEKRLSDVEEARSKIQKEILDDELNLIKAETDRLEDIKKAVETQQEYNDTLGMSREEQERYRIGKLELIRVEMQQRLVQAELSEAEINAIEAQIEAQEKLILLSKEAADKSVAIEEAKKAKEAWDEASKSIADSLTDALLRGFESGKGMLDNLVSTAKNLFQTLVLRPIIQPVVQAGSNAVLSMLGLSAAGPAMASSGAGGIGSLGGLGAALAGFSGAFGAGAFGSLGTLGLTSGVGLGGTLSAAGSLIGTGTGAGIGAGVGMGFGAIAPYAAGAFALYSIGKSLFGGGGGPKVGGSYESQPFFGGDSWVWNGGKLFAENQQDAQAREIAQTWQQAFAATAQAFGGNAGALPYGFGFSTDPEGKAGGRVAGFVGTQYFNQPGLNESEEAMQAAIGQTMAQMTLAGLQQANLSTVFADYFRSIDISSATEEQVTAAIAAAQAALSMAEATRDLAGVFARLGDASVEARNNVLELTGGLDAFVQKVGGYVSAFYSADEQAAIQAASIARTLTSVGIDVSNLDTKAEFRALVDAVDLSAEAGQQQLAALLNVSQQFADLVEYMAETGTSIAGLANNLPDGIVTQLELQQRPLEEAIDAQTASLDNVATAVAETGTKQAEAIEMSAAVTADGLKRVIDLLSSLDARVGDIEHVIRLEAQAP